MLAIADIFTIAVIATIWAKCYEIVTRPGELFSFIPRALYIVKINVCTKCLAGWIAIVIWWFGYFWFISFTAVPLAIIATYYLTKNKE